jgi:hypothetical protein
MPDVRGQPLRQALAMLAALRAEVEIDGSGLVVQQVPAAGAPLAASGPIRLTLARPALGHGRAAAPAARVTPAVARTPMAITKVGGTE